MVFTISINAPDNAGKTTQLALLPSHWSVNVLGPLHNYSEKLSRLHRDGTLTEWWWFCDDPEFVKTILDALAARHAGGTI